MKNKKIKIILLAVLGLIIILVAGFYIYTLDFYKADSTAIELLQDVERITVKNNVTIFSPEETLNIYLGIIFYPGGKVEDIAYAPLLKAISDKGITCFLIRMPFNLAVFNINAADDILNEYIDIDKWYIAGHSLGGAMASSYIKEKNQYYDGLILLGAYPVNDEDIPILAIYGSEDLKLDVNKLNTVQNKFEIIGGNHAYFGNYGEQEGDGTASISRKEQQNIAVEYIVEFTMGE